MTTGMTNEEAWLYAASSGSYIHDGDPGACLYGFDENFRVQSEAHRADCLRQMRGNKLVVHAYPQDYAPDEIGKIDALIAKLISAPVEGN